MAVFAGMIVQGDVDLDDELGDNDRRHIVIPDKIGQADSDLDRRIDRIVDRATRRIDVRDGDEKTIESDPAMRSALVGAAIELARAEVSLAKARNDDNLPEAAVEQVEQRRDLAREAVERIANETRSDSRSDRDRLRDTIREEIRSAVRG
jgi:hypothetical protein